MDTDNLSREAYRAVILETEKVTHDLTLHFGALASTCKNETEYLENAELLIEEIKGFNRFELDGLLFGNVPNRIQLRLTLKNMLNNIDKVRKIALKERHYDF